MGLLFREIARFLETQGFWNEIREGPSARDEMHYQGDDDPAAGIAIAPYHPGTDKQRDLVQGVNWSPEQPAIQSPAAWLNDHRIAGPDSIDQKRFIDTATEAHCAKDDSGKHECGGRYRRENRRHART